MDQRTVAADDLHRVVYNLRLFQVGKLARPAILEFGDDLRGSIQDGHTYLVDRAPTASENDDSVSLGVPPEELKALELWLRDRTGDLRIHHRVVDLIISDEDGREIVVTVYHGVFDEMKDILDLEQTGPCDHTVGYFAAPFAVNPDRSRKLSLVKPGDYPVDSILVSHDDYGDILLMKIGPTVRVALSTLDRKILAEAVDSDQYLW